MPHSYGAKDTIIVADTVTWRKIIMPILPTTRLSSTIALHRLISGHVREMIDYIKSDLLPKPANADAVKADDCSAIVDVFRLSSQ